MISSAVGRVREYECRKCGQCERNTKEKACDGLVRGGLGMSNRELIVYVTLVMPTVILVIMHWWYPRGVCTYAEAMMSSCASFCR